jgi:tRNA A37 threonylcarbamoyladenosine modification protein TsaB
MQLVIECATAACSVALIDGERLIDERHELVGPRPCRAPAAARPGADRA